MIAYAFPPLQFVGLTCVAIGIGVAASVRIVVTMFKIAKGNFRWGGVFVADCVAVAAFAVVCLLRHRLYPEPHWDLRFFDWMVFAVPALLTFAFMFFARKSG